MIAKMFNLIGVMCLLVCCFSIRAQVPSTTWRGLIVYTDNIEAQWPGHDWYPDHVANLLSVGNSIYSYSGMSANMQVAGLIRDHTSYVGGNYTQMVSDVYNPGGSLGHYIALMNQYAADILILISLETPVSIYGGATYLGPPSGHAGLWSVGWSGPIIVHEVGHIHGLDHCTGFRRSFDNMGNYVTSGSVAFNGFHTVMQYQGGGTGCVDDGEDGVDVQPTLSFADAGLAWWNPALSRWEWVGATGHEDVALHSTYESTIRALKSTPSNLVIADTMKLADRDFADFIALNSVRIDSGFRTEGHARLRITVGTSVMAKRGVTPDNHFVREVDDQEKDFGPVKNFAARFDRASRSVKVVFAGEPGSKVSVFTFDVQGVKKKDFGRFSLENGEFSRIFAVNELPMGQYFIQVTVGNEKIYRAFTIH